MSELRNIIIKFAMTNQRKDFTKDVNELTKQIKKWAKDCVPKRKKITKEILEEDKQCCAYFSDGWNNAIIEIKENIEEV